MLKNLLEAAGFDPNGPPRPPHLQHSTPFVQQFETCEVHGKYPLNMQDELGRICSYPEGCPACLKARNTARLLQGSNLPKRFADCTFANFQATTKDQKHVLARCREYADGFRLKRAAGTGLILCGNPGTGKNHLATAICKQLLAGGFSVLRVKASDYLDAYWGKDFKERDAWIRSLTAVDLLMLDELGRSAQTKPAQDAFFRLIDSRYEAELPTLLTTNLDKAGLIEVLGDAAYDRLTQGGTTRLTLAWESFRAQAKKETEA